MPTPRFIDLSHHNVVPQDFHETQKAGIIAVVHKLTEGSSYTDSKVQARYYLAQEAGLAWGVYHFLRPSGDMKLQAEFFWNTGNALGVIDDDTMLCADHEDQDVSGEHLKEFLDHLEDMSGRSPVIYSGHVLKEQLEGSGYRPQRRLWLCQYTSGTPTLPDGVDAYWAWQYTDQGQIAGVDPPTDLNTFEGDDIAFLDGWSGWHGGPEPPVEITEVTVTVTVEAPPGVKVTVVTD